MIKKYLTLIKKPYAKAASEIGITRQYLYMIDKGLVPSVRIARKIESWSDGYIKATDILGLK